MFAILKQDGTIDHLTETEPEVPTVFLPVVDGTKPSTSSPFGTIIERPLAEWTIGATQVTRLWQEYVPPMSDCRAMKDAFVGIAHQATMKSGVTVSGVTLACDDASVSKFTGKAVMLDLAVRNGAITLQTPATIHDINDNVVTLTTQQMLGLLLQFGAAYEGIFQARKNKQSQIATASTIQQLTEINQYEYRSSM